MTRLETVPRNRLKKGLAIVLAGLVVFGAAVAIRNTFFRPKTITAFFPTATAIYPGDDVRVSGLKVGTIEAIEPQGTQAKLVMHVDSKVPIPADAKAVIVAQNLVAARYVQLTPAYRSSGPTMGDGAVIPVDRTAVPVEWDQIKDQLMRLATDFGPNSKVSTPSVARFIDAAADALGNGNGDKLRQTLAQLSGVGRIFANGSGNLVDIIKNLQTFVGALRDSNVQLVQFNNRLATLTSVLDDNKSDLDAALTDLAGATGEVQRFIAGSRNQTAEQIARLADLTQILVDNKMALQNVLHVAPNALANAYNDYDPDVGNIRGGVGLQNFSNPTFALCSQIGALENVTGTETGKLCGLYLSPAFKVANPLLFFNFNYLPIPVNPFLAPVFDSKNVIYTEDRLAPHGEGPKLAPPDLPPAVSAYRGLPGDTPDAPPPPPPLGRIPGAAMPDPPPVSVPPEPPPAPANVPDMLLPGGGPQQ
jgi:phospholipid/cholesterol/gamma-HCH transport system substrate-binding protein